jgi:hypothetical protein
VKQSEVMERVGKHRVRGRTLLFTLLSTTTETENQVQSGFLLNVVISQSTSIFQLLSSENQTLLVRGNSFLVLNLGLDIVNGVRGFHFKGDGLSCEGLDKNLPR